MANIGKNRGRRLRLAISRFAAMLIEEAQSISGLSYAELDEALGLPDGQAQAFRYSRYPIDENDLLNTDRLVIGTPDSVDIDDAEDVDLQLAYEGDWPTFRRLKAADLFGYEPIDSLIKRGAPMEEWPEMFVLYAWQWGVLWEREVPWLMPDNGCYWLYNLTK